MRIVSKFIKKNLLVYKIDCSFIVKKFGQDEKDKPVYTEKCTDDLDTEHCQAQQKRGDCFAFAKYMSKSCSRSCHFCEQGKIA